jgi:hypothetical protein
MPELSDTTTGSASAQASERVEQSVENWKRKLLDPSKRNRLLHFKPTWVSTVAVVDELPVEVFRQLHLGRRTMRFKPLPEKPDAATTGPVDDADPLDLDLDTVPLGVLLPPVAEEGAERDGPRGATPMSGCRPA